MICDAAPPGTLERLGSGDVLALIRSTDAVPGGLASAALHAFDELRECGWTRWRQDAWTWVRLACLCGRNDLLEELMGRACVHGEAENLALEEVHVLREALHRPCLRQSALRATWAVAVLTGYEEACDGAEHRHLLPPPYGDWDTSMASALRGADDLVLAALTSVDAVRYGDGAFMCAIVKAVHPARLDDTLIAALAERWSVANLAHVLRGLDCTDRSNRVEMPRRSLVDVLMWHWSRVADRTPLNCSNAKIRELYQVPLVIEQGTIGCG